MSGELTYLKNSRRRKLVWLAAYLVLAVVAAVALLAVLDKARDRVLPAGKLELEFSQSKYVVGEPVIFTLTNHLNTPIYVSNRCPSEPLEVYRKEDGKWKRLHGTAGEGKCPDETRQITVAANAATTASFAPWQQLFDRPGMYRIVADVDNYESIVYRDFEVVERPTSPASDSSQSSDSALRETKQQERESNEDASGLEFNDD